MLNLLDRAGNPDFFLESASKAVDEGKKNLKFEFEFDSFDLPFVI